MLTAGRGTVADCACVLRDKHTCRWRYLVSTGGSIFSPSPNYRLALAYLRIDSPIGHAPDSILNITIIHSTGIETTSEVELGASVLLNQTVFIYEVPVHYCSQPNL